MLDKGIKEKAIKRSKIIEGQVIWLTKAIEEEKYCIDLLTQSRAIQKSLQSLDRLVMENHLMGHVKEMLNDEKKSHKALKELMDVFSFSNK